MLVLRPWLQHIERRGTALARVRRIQGVLRPTERLCQPLPLRLPWMLLPLRRRHAGVLVHVGELHLYCKLNVGKGDLVAEPEVPLVAEVTASKADAQLGDEGAEVGGGHALDHRLVRSPLNGATPNLVRLLRLETSRLCCLSLASA